MDRRKRQFVALAASLIMLSGSASGQQGGGTVRREEPPPPSNEIQRSAVTFNSPWRPAGAGTSTRIVGTVIDIRQVPVAHARVQLRNLDTGNIEQEADADSEGEYGFELADPGTYVVEMVMVDGYVLALSNAGSIGRYETMQTVVQLPGRWNESARTMVLPQNMANFLGLSSETSLTTTTLQIAADDNIRATDPGVPVSPK